MKIRALVNVTGLVQGVNFRFYTLQSALKLNVTGWVRNLPDGSVEGCFEGEETDVNALIAWCRTGPDSARVDEVVVDRGEFRGDFDGFVVKR
ncbi:MAG TPA: acylphosphatase [Geobacteraceae bacterium]|nr:acylphosphatase [Geobacteraceae bacterium]